MECTYFASEMWRPPSFQVLLLPIYQVQVFPVQFPNKVFNNSKPLFTSFRCKSSCSVVLDTIESYPTSSNGVARRKNFVSEAHDSIHRRISDINISAGEEFININRKERLKRYSKLLHDCASKGSLNEAMTIHGQQIISGMNPDSHFWVSLINVYAKCGQLVYARRLLAEMPEQDVISWTALIQGFVGQGNGKEGINLFREMRKGGIVPNEFTLATCLKACSMCLNLNFAKQVQAEAIKVGVLSDLFVGSALVDLYAKCGEMDLANRIFFCMPEQNEVLWNILLNGHAQMGDSRQVLRLFCRMLLSEVKFSKITLSSVIKGCANSGDLRNGQIAHCLAIKSGCELDKFLDCSLMDMYSKCDQVGDALKMFYMIKDHDVVSWSAMITCLDQQGHSKEAVKLFYLMKHTGVQPNQFTFASVVSAASDLGDLNYGQSIHACICKYGFESEVTVSNALTMMYMKNGCVSDGVRVFEAIPEPDLVSWNALLSGFHDYDSCEAGPRTFYQMLLEGFRPNMYTYISVLRSCSSLLDAGFGKQVHAQVLKNNLHGNEYVGTALVDMYAQCRNMDEAYTVFDRLVHRDVFTWTVIITGFAQTDQAEKALGCFNLMQQEGVKPNEFTVACCLSGCSQITATETGRGIHSMALKSGHLHDIFVSSALVDMYAKCGCIEDAEPIFQGLVRRDTVLWNTMICGFSLHGQGEKALETFQAMIDEGNVPDEVTFLGVLSACSHMGLIEKGKQHFNSMSSMYGISPRDEHYACMVDILSRAGRFDEVESFIEEMKLTEHALIWETILGACTKYGNINFGERAAAKLFELKPETDSNYILLSNIFASKGKWEDVRKVRTLMSSQGVKKEPGCSWLEINNQVHAFISDGLHPNIKEIHLKLEELSQKLRFVGYTPQTEHALHNVSELEKTEHLNHHSEKLALAFALISSSSMKKIRIFKNLRICCDCHNFMKLVSEITNKEIVVRDTNRFHLFKSGSCSCQDYW